ncbi:antibiotic biosynthesis monooxygenase family protein [Roseateles albus]|uniref:Antibiotic biosynthesis monooxygenase n=1 Tax=Roseateles albus TaxID=2987525 RepID=A0ABT5KNR7_9BURK|nr:antibiotic biosynthesis monooxygenase family protein [Roseateles albus]MDC8774540.1 antibiotic biosynthesis monooxygenase [Roseateles albus]
MILEIAEIQIPPGQQAAFEAAIAHGIKTVIAQAQGFMSARVQHGLESPERYILQIEWASLEDHTVHFRGGPLFPAWRAIVGPFFAQPPRVEHFERII